MAGPKDWKAREREMEAAISIFEGARSRSVQLGEWRRVESLDREIALAQRNLLRFREQGSQGDSDPSSRPASGPAEPDVVFPRR